MSFALELNYNSKISHCNCRKKVPRDWICFKADRCPYARRNHFSLVIFMALYNCPPHIYLFKWVQARTIVSNHMCCSMQFQFYCLCFCFAVSLLFVFVCVLCCSKRTPTFCVELLFIIIQLTFCCHVMNLEFFYFPNKNELSTFSLNFIHHFCLDSCLDKFNPSNLKSEIFLQRQFRAMACLA